MTSLEQTKVTLLIIDNLMHEMNEVVAKLITKGSHHRNTSVLLLAHNIFQQNKQSRTVGLNTIYNMVQFRYLRSSYEDATIKHYDYLLIDQNPDMPNLLRLRTDLFPGGIHYVYHKI